MDGAVLVVGMCGACGQPAADLACAWCGMRLCAECAGYDLRAAVEGDVVWACPRCGEGIDKARSALGVAS